MSEWVVVRYKFNEESKVWMPDGSMIFKTDEDLLKYLRSQAHVGHLYRHEITTLGGGE